MLRIRLREVGQGLQITASDLRLSARMYDEQATGIATELLARVDGGMPTLLANVERVVPTELGISAPLRKVIEGVHTLADEAIGGKAVSIDALLDFAHRFDEFGTQVARQLPVR